MNAGRIERVFKLPPRWYTNDSMTDPLPSRYLVFKMFVRMRDWIAGWLDNDYRKRKPITKDESLNPWFGLVPPFSPQFQVVHSSCRLGSMTAIKWNAGLWNHKCTSHVSDWLRKKIVLLWRRKCIQSFTHTRRLVSFSFPHFYTGAHAPPHTQTHIHVQTCTQMHQELRIRKTANG